MGLELRMCSLSLSDSGAGHELLRLRQYGEARGVNRFHLCLSHSAGRLPKRIPRLLARRWSEAAW
jgi:hypothetical protein